MAQVLLIEDSLEIQKIIVKLLEPVAGVRVAATLAEARVALRTQPFDLALVDVSLPDGSGFGVVAEIRADAELAEFPIFLLTAKHETSDKLQAFQLGADDYITKPFNPLELRARIEARLRRRAHGQDKLNILTVANLRLDLRTQVATVGRAPHARTVELSSLEFKLLAHFMQRPEHVLSRDQIIERIWGLNTHVTTRTVDTHVSHLRRKLKGSEFGIATVVGAGYAFKPELVSGAKAA
jgi:two-component system phosphate regulon response regulator PhoB